MHDIHVDINPGHDVLDKISIKYPRNPFYTVNYVKAVQENGAETIVFTVPVENETNEYCLAHLFRGRLGNSLVIYSLTEISRSESFWMGMRRFLGAQRIYHAYFGSYASPDSIRIAEIDKKLDKTERTEYAVDLQTDELWQQVSKHHKRQIKKARRTGVTIENNERTGSENGHTMDKYRYNAELCEMHKTLMDCSMARRKMSNKSYVSDVDNSLCRPFLENSAGTIYRAVLENEVIASSMILKSKESGYYHSSGNSAAATKTGASHLLIYTVMEDLKNEGQKVFNLGGGNNEMEGLDRFKMGFGASHISLAAAEINRMPMVMRVASKVAAWIGKK